MKLTTSLLRTLIACGSLIVLPTVHADNIWDGGGSDNNWDTAENWGLDALPTWSSALTFVGNTQNSTNNNHTATTTIGGINFTNDGSTGKTNGFTLAGNSITLGGNITATKNAAGTTSTITNTISLDLILNGNRTITTNQLSNTVQHNLIISGNISGTGFGITKAGAGSLKLSGTNTYSGVTTNGFTNPANSGLYFLGMQALSSNTSITEANNGGVGGTGTIYFLDDSATPASRSTVNLTHDQKNSSQNAMSVFVGNASTTNGGLSSSTQTGSTIELGNMNFNQTATGATGGAGLTVNGANGYGLKLANVNVSLQALYTANWNVKLNAVSAPLTVTGNVQQAAGGGGTTTLQLDGSATGNEISGNVLDSADGTPKTMNVTKLGTGDWTLSSASNSFTGTITMGATTTSSGTLKYASAAGTNPITFAATTGFGSTLDYIGSSALTMSGAFTISALTNGGITINANGTTSSDTINYSNTGSIGGSGSASSNTGFITFGGANTGDNIFASQIVNNSATMKRQVSKTGDGTWVLTGDSTFTGGFFLNQGTLKIASVGNGTDSGPLGMNTRINIGNGNNDGTLVFTGAGSTTDRDVRIGNPTATGTGGSVIQNDGTGALTFTAATFNPTIASITASRTLTLGGSYTGSANEIQGVIQDNDSSTGKIAVTKTGAGTWKLSGANTYTGLTTVSDGTLSLASTGSISSSSGVKLSTSTAKFNVTTADFTLGSSQTLSGIGTVENTGRTFTADGTIAPGHSPGTLTVDGGTLALGLGGSYDFQVLNAIGAAGTGYDSVDLINGATLDFSSLTSASYTINLFSLSSTGPDVSGDASNFNNTLSYSWTLFSTTSSLFAGFDPTDFTINTAGFSNALGGGTFSLGLADSNTDLVLNFTPVPEPRAALLGSIGLLMLIRRRR